MLGKTDLIILKWMRTNSRISLAKISRKEKIPVTTLFDRLKKLNVIRKTILINNSSIGWPIRAYGIIKMPTTKTIEKLRAQRGMNNLYRTENGEIIFDMYFKSLYDAEKKFHEESFESEISVFYIVEEIKTEGFFTEISE